MHAFLLATGLVLLAGGAFAQNIGGLMKDRPANFFTEEDNRLFRAVWAQVLEDTPDNGTRSWNNPKSGSGGDLTLERTFDWRGNVCKEVRIRNHAQGRKADTTLNSCKMDGKWRLLSDEQLKK